MRALVEYLNIVRVNYDVTVQAKCRLSTAGGTEPFRFRVPQYAKVFSLKVSCPKNLV